MKHQLLTIEASENSHLLKQVATRVELSGIASNKNFQQKVDLLINTRIKNNGFGIAAPQIGWMERVFTVGSPEGNPRYPHLEPLPETTIVNPEIALNNSETFYNFEKCLSIPAKSALVPRALSVTVSGFSRFGEPICLEIAGPIAGIFQHENDHLDGILITDKTKEKQHLFEGVEFPEFEYQLFLKTTEIINKKHASFSVIEPKKKKANKG